MSVYLFSLREPHLRTSLVKLLAPASTRSASTRFGPRPQTLAAFVQFSRSLLSLVYSKECFFAHSDLGWEARKEYALLSH